MVNHLRAQWAARIASAGHEMPAQLWIPHGGAQLNIGHVNPIAAGSAGFGNKPFGGLWTSSLNHYGSDWLDWVRGEMPKMMKGVQSFWVLTPDPTAKVYEIDNEDDLEDLKRQYPAKGDSYMRETGLDWPAVYRDYDGVHLTEEGQWRTRGRSRSGISLYGWDVESTCWARWVFKDAQHVDTLRLGHTASVEKRKSPLDYRSGQPGQDPMNHLRAQWATRIQKAAETTTRPSWRVMDLDEDGDPEYDKESYWWDSEIKDNAIGTIEAMVTWDHFGNRWNWEVNGASDYPHHPDLGQRGQASSPEEAKRAVDGLVTQWLRDAEINMGPDTIPAYHGDLPWHSTPERPRTRYWFES